MRGFGMLRPFPGASHALDPAGLRRPAKDAVESCVYRVMPHSRESYKPRRDRSRISGTRLQKLDCGQDIRNDVTFPIGAHRTVGTKSQSSINAGAQLVAKPQ